MSTPSRMDILIDIKARLNELAQSQEAFRSLRQEAQGFGTMLKTGLGIDFARRGVELFKRSVTDAFGEAFALAKEIQQNARAMGLSGEAYQVFKEELSDAGLEMGKLTQAMSTQHESLAQVRRGAAEATTAYRDLGLVASEVEQLSPGERVLAVARAMHEATDRTAAFSAASTILGRRGLPELMEALKRLSTEGYAPLAEGMQKAGRLMSDETAALLRQQQKQIEDLKNLRTTAMGEILGFYTLLTQAVFNNPIGVLKATFVERHGALDRLLADFMPKAAAPVSAPGGPSMASADEALLGRILALQQKIADISSNPLLAEIRQREQLLPLLLAQANAYQQIIDAQFPDAGILTAKGFSGVLTEEELSRFKEYISLLAQKAAVDNLATGIAAPKSEATQINEAYQTFSAGKDSQGGALLAPGESFTAGLQQWAMQSGTAGQQIAGTFTDLVGGSVNTLSDGLTGLITKTKDWGDVGRSAGSMFLQALVQLGVQLAMNFALSKIMGAEESRKTKQATGEKAAEAGMKSIAQLGPIWGTVAFAGSIAAILAMIGGFRAAGGPVSAGVPYIVGEKRPEVFVPTESGSIVPSVDAYRVMTRRAGGGSAVGGAVAAGGAGAGAFAGVSGEGGSRQKQKLLVVYTDHSHTVDALKRNSDFESAVLDILDRNRGDLLSL